jgi:4-hydroxybenzoate polyprenyltransferase
MNRQIAYGFALFIAAWGVAALVFGEPVGGAVLLALAAAMAVWGSKLGDKR